MILFSIISVTYNNLSGLKQTSKSIQKQTWPNFEWIVIDGASADGTIDYLTSLSPLPCPPPSLRGKGWVGGAPCWLSEPDRGIYDAMNKGIDRTTGDYLIFMNAGDCFAEAGTLEKISEALNSQQPDFIYGDAWGERSGQPPALKKARPAGCYIKGMVTHRQAMLYRRDKIGALRYDTSYKIAADYKFTAQFLRQDGAALYLNFPLCLFECGGVSQRRVRQGRNEQFRARRELKLCGLPQNIVIYMAQTMLMILRRLAPNLYWRLRQSSGNSATGPGPDRNPAGRPENPA
jgi:putative colanic acid biosynthesis glycosyltransferase